MKKIIKKTNIGLALLLLVPTVIILLGNRANAYNPSLLMSDNIFADVSYSQDQIQNFLASKNSYLASYHEVEDCGSSGGAHYSYYATYYSCGQSVLASKIIYDAGRAYSINPRALIATMQKEQSLITAQNPISSQITCAMGYNSCNGFGSFFLQVDNGAWQFRTYIELMNGRNWWGYTPSSYPCKNASSLYSAGLYPGNTVTFYNPGGSARTVTLGSSATAGLYCYTPYVGPYSETGYSGSYNFVIWYEQWFGPTVNEINLPNNAGSAIALAANQDGTLQLAGVVDNERIYSRRQSAPSTDSWGSWTQIPGGLRNISAGTNADGRIELVGVASNGNVYHTSQTAANSTSWNSWAQMDGWLMTSAMASNADGTIEIAGLVPDGSIYVRRQNSPSTDDWSTWTNLPGGLNKISAQTNADGRIQLVGIAVNGNIYSTSQTAPNSTSWNPWVQMDGWLMTSALARNADGTLEVIGIAPNEAIYIRRQTAPSTDSWGPWAQLPGGLRNIAAQTNADGRIQLIGVACNGNIYSTSQTATNSISWNPWVQKDGWLRTH